MKITEIASDCISIELMKGDVAIQTDRVVCLVNPFDLVAKLARLDIGGLVLWADWINPNEDEAEYIEMMDEINIATKRRLAR